MTSPLGDNVGKAEIEFHADMKAVPEEVAAGLEEAKLVADAEGDKIGGSLGNHIGGGLKKEFEKSGPVIAKTVEDAVSRETIAPKPKFNFRGLFGGGRGRSVGKDIVRDLEDGISSATRSSAGPGGPIDQIGKTIGQTISDGVGSVFNVSGKSPLIALLIPVFGELGLLIGALVQSLSLAGGLLAALPSVIFGIGASVGTLALVFHGLGSAISAAFAAKNAKELNAAVAGLPDDAAKFVKELLPLRDLFKQIQGIVQETFFLNLSVDIKKLIADLGPLITMGLVDLATALAHVFSELANFFDSPTFQKFLTDIFPATAKWLEGFGPALVSFLTGVTALADSALPFLNLIGADLNSILKMLGDLFSNISTDPKFKSFLDEMTITFDDLLGVLKAAGIFVVAFLDSLNKAGGEDLLTTLTTQLLVLAAFFESDAGQHAMIGFVNTLIFLGDTFVGIVLIIGFLFAALEEFFEWLTTIAGPGIADWAEGVWHSITDFFDRINDAVARALDGASQTIGNVIGFVKDIPNKIKDAIGDLGSLLYNAGKNLINGLWNGVKAAVPNFLGYLGGLAVDIAKHKGPPEKDAVLLKPAGKLIMAGLGEGIKDGATDVMKMLDNFTLGIAGANVGVSTTSQNIAFSPGSVQVNFNGAVPTPEQAAKVGMSVGAGIQSQLAVRNARLAVRTL